MFSIYIINNKYNNNNLIKDLYLYTGKYIFKKMKQFL